MRQTPSEMHMYAMVTIDTIIFEIVGGGGAFKTFPPPRIVNCLKYNGSDRVYLFYLFIQKLYSALFTNECALKPFSMISKTVV